MFAYDRLDVVFRRNPLKNEKQNLQAQYKISNDK